MQYIGEAYTTDH